MIEGFSLGAVDDEAGEPTLHGPADTGPGVGAEINWVETNDESGGASLTTSDRDEGSVAPLDAVAGFLGAPNLQGFLGSLIGVLSPLAISGDSGARTMLRLLGAVLADGLDEELALNEILEALDRRHFRSDSVVVAVAALLARKVASASLPNSPVEVADLIHAAAQVVREAIEGGRTRPWQLLPRLAATIARRSARRGSPMAQPAAALPQRSRRSITRPPVSTASNLIEEQTDAGEPRRMYLRGPVEIVILGR